MEIIRVNMTKNKMLIMIANGMIMAALIGCGSVKDDADLNTETVTETEEANAYESDEIEDQVSQDKEKETSLKEEASKESSETTDLSGDDNIYEQFLNDELELDGEKFSEIFSFMYEDFETEPVTFYYDVDEDGKDELLVSTVFYGYNIYDVRDGKLVLLDCGDGTAAACGVYEGNGHVYVSHSDFSHAGRKMLTLTRYDQGGNVTETITINAEYWDSETDMYDENSDFTYNGQKITMKEYEEYMNSFVFIDPDSEKARLAP